MYHILHEMLKITDGSKHYVCYIDINRICQKVKQPNTMLIQPWLQFSLGNILLANGFIFTAIKLSHEYIIYQIDIFPCYIFVT